MKTENQTEAAAPPAAAAATMGMAGGHLLRGGDAASRARHLGVAGRGSVVGGDSERDSGAAAQPGGIHRGSIGNGDRHSGSHPLRARRRRQRSAAGSHRRSSRAVAHPCAAPLAWKPLAAGFILFRAFDILKPWPIRRLEKLPEGIGIVMDDLGAGVYASIVLQLLLRAGILS